MPKDGIEYTRSALASVDVATAVKDYHIESTSVVSVPKDDERARYPPNGIVALYVDYLRAGLRVPVCELVLRVLEYYKIHITQLTPNAVGRIIGFEVLCRAEGKDPTIETFRYFFQIQISGDWYSFSTRAEAPELMYGFPDSIKGWKGRFIFIQSAAAGFKTELMWKKPGKVKDPPPLAGEYDGVTVNVISPLVFYFKKLSERVLIAACMSPVPASPAFPLKKGRKKYIFIITVA